MKRHIDSYLKAHESAWAPSTLKSERSRLTALSSLLHLSPGELFTELSKTKKPYTVKTIFIRVVNLEKWAKLPPSYAGYMEAHERRFRSVYEKEDIKVTYLDALARIETLPTASRIMALAVLKCGCRISEAYTFRDGRVTGKGSKTRKIYGKIEGTVPQTTFRRHLKAVGLKPHTLRKLCATRLAEKGATAADLCKVFGWSSIETSYYYLQGKEDKKLEALMAASEEES